MISITSTEQYRNRIFITIAIASAACLIIVAQLVRWQIIEHEAFVKLASQQHQREIILKPRRGNIYDSVGHLLAADTIQYEISASPNLISDPHGTAKLLNQLLGISGDKLYHALISERLWVLISRSATREVGEQLLNEDIVGLTITPHPKRAYPEGKLAAHLLGFVNYNHNGFHGIEGYYDRILHGVDGRQFGEHGPFGDVIPLGQFEVIPPTQGADLYLTLDRTIQHIITDELSQAIERYEAKSGTIIVMNPNTGAVLASVSLPTFNPNMYEETSEDIISGHSVRKVYEPGSVFKIITIAAALDSKLVSPETRVHDRGSVEIGGRTIYNSDRQAHGTVDMTTILAKSLNVGTAQIAAYMGAKRYYNYVQRFGFGRLTEVDLDMEEHGTLKTPMDNTWHESDLATNSFGQGIAVTPIQMVTAVSAIANDGILLKPHVVQKIISYDEPKLIEIKPQIVRRAVSIDTAQTLTIMLADALEISESKALLPGYRIAGKTGTAEIPIAGGYHPNLTITSFVGYFPIDEPQVVVLIILDSPKTSKWGATTAAPVFKFVAERLIRAMEIPPDAVRLAVQEE